MEKSSEKLTDINQIGEFGLIDLITKDFEMIVRNCLLEMMQPF